MYDPLDSPQATGPPSGVGATDVSQFPYPLAVAPAPTLSPVMLMIEKSVHAGPHVTAVETRRHKRTGASLPATQFLCHRPIHETYRCPHGEVTYCVGEIKPGQAEVEEVFHARFDCPCTIGEAASSVVAQRYGSTSH